MHFIPKFQFKQYIKLQFKSKKKEGLNSSLQLSHYEVLKQKFACEPGLSLKSNLIIN